MVVTTYPGASAHQVELEVTDVLEKNIRSMGNIDNVESYSYNDLSLIQVELKTTVKETDVEQCWDLLRRKVANAQAELPEGASPSIVKDDFGNVYGMFFALTGDGLSANWTVWNASIYTATVRNVSTSPYCKTEWPTWV